MSHKKNHRGKVKKSAAKPRRQPVRDNAKQAWPVPQLIEKSDVVDTTPLATSPYGIFAPAWDMFTLPWRLLMPFTPWPR